jgi:hypothetical protein
MPHREDRRAAKHAPVLRVLKKTPYLLEVASLMVAVSIGAALLDFLFKAQAAAALSKGPALTRFFALFYTVTGLLGVAVQAFLASPILTRFGLASTVSSLPLSVLAGGGWVLAFSSFLSMTAVRGLEVILRGSLFRSGYEVFYTPVPSEDKRAVKAIIDVTGERLGDFIGSGIVGTLLLLHLAGNTSILGSSIVFAALGLFLAKRLETSYASALENSLRKQAVRLAPEPVYNDFGAGVILEPPPKLLEAPIDGHHHSVAHRDPLMRDLSELRSDDEACVIRALSRIQDPHPLVLQQLIQFLGNDRYAFFVMDHLRRAVSAHVGQFVDTLLNPAEPLAIRKRIPLILAGTDSQRALDQLLIALSDPEFLLRFRSAHAMSQIHTNHPELYLSQDRIWQILDQELQVSIEVWEQRRLLDAPSDPEPDSEEELERPGDASLEYLFVLLGLVLPRQPVLMAFRALQTDDRHLRGTALEYLQTVLPNHAWKCLEDLIGDRTIGARPARPRAAGGV